mgnify:CR=1 FL=1
MPLQFFPNKPHFDFMGKRWVGFAASIALTLLSFGLIATKGLNLGIDFTGGILMETHAAQEVDLAPLRDHLNHQGFGEVSLQHMGSKNDILIRVQVAKDDEQAKVVAHIKEILTAQLGNSLDYRKIDFVGPTVGKELIAAGVYATLLSFAAIMLYLWFRFEWQYGLGGILALFHDSVMVIGFSHRTGKRASLPTVWLIFQQRSHLLPSARDTRIMHPSRF